MKGDTVQHISQDHLTRPIEGRDHIQGPITAPVTLLEYGDYECPYCADANLGVRQIQEILGEDLCFAYRNFPLTDVHPHAEHAAEAAEAAAAQGAFWEMHNALFENQDALQDRHLAEYAAKLGLDESRLSREVAEGAHLEHIREDFQSGIGAGVDGTPVFFINGLRYDGESDPESMLAAIKQVQRGR